MILPIIDQNRKWNHQTLYSIKSWDLTQSLANNARLTPCLSFVQDCLQLASISIITLPHIKMSLISLYWWHHIKLSLVTHWRYPSIPFSCAKSLEMNSTIIIDSWRVFLGDFNNSPNANYQLVSMLAKELVLFRIRSHVSLQNRNGVPGLWIFFPQKGSCNYLLVKWWCIM